MNQFSLQPLKTASVTVQPFKFLIILICIDCHADCGGHGCRSTHENHDWNDDEDEDVDDDAGDRNPHGSLAFGARTLHVTWKIGRWVREREREREREKERRGKKKKKRWGGDESSGRERVR